MTSDRPVKETADDRRLRRTGRPGHSSGDAHEAGAALVASLFMPDVPLRAQRQPALAEVPVDDAPPEAASA